ncbi:ABC transporter substrate-binding protein [Roseisolibacter sp. H3M3-2]|uniref:ABC transporter substrate-binding protein n=1 Tax=Roseisolibacter sp. H3M3-2 TaxID=3031323 RepID=UPI0023DC3FD9|nr:ABC transporter substrate-binding protein [Roseisolibacter sp. H3M3-2]MDF1505282.1 ABC transporter substrate-binding protein [Roseisolibacter sp. H3M3-2]
MRVVALLPAATEIVAALGAADRLVGVTHECDHPRDAVLGRARVTRPSVPSHLDGATPAEIDAAVRERSATGAPLFALDEAAIAALDPDVLLTQGLCDVCAVWEGDVRALAERLGARRGAAPRVATLGGTTLDGVLDDVAALAAELGLEAAGAALVERARARVRAVHETLKAARAPRPRVAVVEWTSPVFLAGHWGPDLVRRAGGVDVLGTVGAHSTTVELAALAAADPEVVLIAPCGYDLAHAEAEARARLADPAWGWLAGRAVWALDANAFLSRPGPRLVDGVEVLAALLHPALFGAPAADAAVRVSAASP